MSNRHSVVQAGNDDNDFDVRKCIKQSQVTQSLTEFNTWRIVRIFQHWRSKLCKFAFKTSLCPEKILQFAFLGFSKYLTNFYQSFRNSRHYYVYTVSTQQTAGTITVAKCELDSAKKMDQMFNHFKLLFNCSTQSTM